ncbi:MAG: hypothetical protein AB7D34_08505 [Sulfurimonas sp.]
MRYFFIIAAFFLSLAFADKSVVKSVTINQMLYPDKTFLEVKEIALDEAKKAAAKEIYGEVLISETVMVGGKVLDDVVRERSGGLVRIKGEPKFRNGENFGDIVVSIEAYATDEDLKNRAKYAPVKEFDIDASDEKISEIRRGFYGVWSGFIMRSGGSSSDVVIKITSSGEATINYIASNCGGELIIQKKEPTKVRFKQKLSYGDDRCTDLLIVELKKISDTQSLFMLLDEDDREVAKGTLYREE